ncbi:hypothetical protein K440DRAFT_264593 [Wilcoxina mikolae CBS 423.85]|nr:hypothetical protein K440DRAFT_264593 [Wilcoxina mikolae CBS 423.85]
MENYDYRRQAPPPPPPQNDPWFLDGEGIEHRVVQSDIPRYLGNNATIRRGTGPENRPGYWYYAYRPLTDAMVQSLKDDSQRYYLERTNPYRHQDEIEYVRSHTFRDSQQRQQRQQRQELLEQQRQQELLEQQQQQQQQQQQHPRQPPAHELAVPQLVPRSVDPPLSNQGPSYAQQTGYLPASTYPVPGQNYTPHPQQVYRPQAPTYGHSTSRYTEYERGSGSGSGGRGRDESYYRTAAGQPHYDYAHVPPGARGDGYTREGPPAQPRYQPAPGGEGYVASDPAPPEESTPSEDHPPPSGRGETYYSINQPQRPPFPGYREA